MSSLFRPFSPKTSSEFVAIQTTNGGKFKPEVINDLSLRYLEYPGKAMSPLISDHFDRPYSDVRAIIL